MKISVITWDGGFREQFHSVEYFARQSFPTDEYEIIWVDYYDTCKPELRTLLDAAPNARFMPLKREGVWQIGTCLNEGARAAAGELLVIVDGDLFVEPDFLERIWADGREHENQVTYVHRFDEPPELYEKTRDVPHTEREYRMLHFANYGACVVIGKPAVERVGGYEEHPIFAEAGAQSKELYVRLRNAGYPIVWHPTLKIYHPAHERFFGENFREKRVKQEHVIYQRAIRLDTQADAEQVDLYLQEFDPGKPPPIMVT